ncbi:hypothetical protein NUSPORA_01452 [Nucleospora cyclopteri]
MEEVEIKIKDLKEPTVKSLVESVITTRKAGEKPSADDVKVFFKSKKLDPSETLEQHGITDESTLFAYIKGAMGKKPIPQQTETIQQNQSQTDFSKNYSFSPGQMPNMGGNPYGNMMGQQSPNMFGNPGMGNLNPSMVQNLLSDPSMVDYTINMIMPNASEEQKKMLKTQFEAVKNNPEMLNMVMNQMQNPAMMQQMSGNPMMGGNPMMNGNPMGTPMMNNYYNPYMQQANMTPPKNGPCFHGFYPLTMENGVPKQQNARIVFKSQIDQISSMGFEENENEIVEILMKYGGNVEKAIEDLLKRKENSQK